MIWVYLGLDADPTLLEYLDRFDPGPTCFVLSYNSLL
jgi:hypothetical protein